MSKKPIVCTLNALQRVGRGNDWRTVLRAAVLEKAELPFGYVLTLRDDPAAIEELNALVDAERACCSWMNLQLAIGPPQTLTITAESIEGKQTIQQMIGA